MTRRSPRLRAFTRDELQTLGYVMGLGSLVWWVVGRINPPPPVAGIVASLLFVQRLFPVRKKERKHGVEPPAMGEVEKVGEAPERGDESGDVGGGGRSDRRRLRRHLHRRPMTRPAFDGGG